MAETFNNIYVYSLDPANALSNEARILPVKWTDPVTGIQHGNMYLYSEEELNSMGWYKVFEEHFDNSPTEYELEQLSLWEWRNISLSFLATYEVVYKDIEIIRATKIANLKVERDQNIIDTLNHKTDDEHREIMYRAIGLLIAAFNQGTAAEIASYVNTNTFLQALKSQLGNLASETIAYNDRITLAETETDIPTLINL